MYHAHRIIRPLVGVTFEDCQAIVHFDEGEVERPADRWLSVGRNHSSKLIQTAQLCHASPASSTCANARAASAPAMRMRSDKPVPLTARASWRAPTSVA